MEQVQGKLYDTMNRSKDFAANASNPERFLDAADMIIASRDRKCIGSLLSYFDDESTFPWVFDSLIRSMESFPDNVYTEEILKGLHESIEKIPIWTGEICNRLFNNTTCFELFRQKLSLAPKEVLLKLFDLMERESPHHRELLSQLRQDVLKLPETREPEC